MWLWARLVWVATGDCDTTEVPHIHLLFGYGRYPSTVFRMSLLLGNLEPALVKCDQIFITGLLRLWKILHFILMRSIFIVFVECQEPVAENIF